MDEILTLTQISKSYPGVQALDKVDFNLRKGEILGLIGENGAGKSTLIKTIGGLTRHDSGTVNLDGNDVKIITPRHAENLGISIIHQELNLLPNLSIADNIFICREPVISIGIIDNRTMHAEAQKLLDMVGLNANPKDLVETLSVSEMQMVEIAKALSHNARILILDEPTSSLTDNEAKILFSIITELKAEGVAMVYVSHKMEEVFDLCDRVQILRDGKHIETLDIKSADEQAIIELMVGRKLENLFKKDKHPYGNEVLNVKNLKTDNGVENVSFSLRAGEVLGFAGLVGAGRTEVMRALFGLDRILSGEVMLDNKNVRIRHPFDAIGNGIGLVPEDRKAQGLILEMSIEKNISLANLKHINRFGVIDTGRAVSIAKEYSDKLMIKMTDLAQDVLNLSGGNQQKVVLAKWLAIQPRILILDEPTRGIDVGAKKEIYHIINELAKDGVAVILISSELIEILSISDRIVVMHEGYSKGILDAENATQEKIMSMALSTQTATDKKEIK